MKGLKAGIQVVEQEAPDLRPVANARGSQSHKPDSHALAGMRAFVTSYLPETSRNPGRSACLLGGVTSDASKASARGPGSQTGLARGSELDGTPHSCLLLMAHAVLRRVPASRHVALAIADKPWLRRRTPLPAGSPARMVQCRGAVTLLEEVPIPDSLAHASC